MNKTFAVISIFLSVRHKRLAKSQLDDPLLKPGEDHFAIAVAPVGCYVADRVAESVWHLSLTSRSGYARTRANAVSKQVVLRLPCVCPTCGKPKKQKERRDRRSHDSLAAIHLRYTD
jgi:hypothetical protein